MGQRVGDGDAGEIGAGPPTERATARREHDAATSRAASAEALALVPQYSESTGTSSAPGTDRSGRTTGPAAIRLSLLASAGASQPTNGNRHGQAGEADHSVDHDVGVLDELVEATSVVPGSAAPSSQPGVVTDGDAGRPELLGLFHQRCNVGANPEGDHLVLTGLGATSSVCVPIEPDDPAMATRTGLFEENDQGVVVHRWQDEEVVVEAIEDTAVALDDRAEVLDVEVALEHALGEVAEWRHHGDDEGPSRSTSLASVHVPWC